jgi:hypothetical protein
MKLLQMDRIDLVNVRNPLTGGPPKGGRSALELRRSPEVDLGNSHFVRCFRQPYSPLGLEASVYLRSERRRRSVPGSRTTTGVGGSHVTALGMSVRGTKRTNGASGDNVRFRGTSNER